MSHEPSVGSPPDAPRGAAQGSAAEVSGPPLTPLKDHEHLLEPVIARAAASPTQIVASYREGDSFVGVTAAEFLERVRAIAKGLIASGVNPGDRVALMSRTRLEWLQIDYAIVAVGAVTVPIYDTSSASQVDHIVTDSEAVLAIAETDEMAELVTQREGGSGSPETLTIDAGGIDELTTRGREVTDPDLDQRIERITIADIATVIYTSGTTGPPKGCVLTHGNLRSNVRQNLGIATEMLGSNERSLFFLPLAHSYAKTIALLAIEYHIEAAFATDIANLVDEMAMTRPTVIVAVPRIFEKVFMAAQARAYESGRGRIFERAVSIAVRYSKERNRGGVGLLTRIEHALFDKLVYGKLRDAFGGSLRIAFSGGSALGERLTYFFDGVGVRIFEGYGLTETSPILSVNRLNQWCPGTVGAPVPGTRLRLASDGEILAAGPQIFQGYWNNEKATAEVLSEDGWFSTGDLGELENGFLRIVGRKKDIIVTAGGKNVAPEPMEDRMRAHPLVSQAVVLGDDRPFVSALVTIDEDALESWLDQHHKTGQQLEDLVDDPDLRAEVQEAVDDANSLVSRAESIRQFCILPDDLSIEREELTPTMKIKRPVVQKHYADQIEQIYQR